MPGVPGTYTTGERKARGVRMSVNYNKKWPEQARAKWLVQTAVKRGNLVKPAVCSRCGKAFPKEKLQAHHHDYSRPLEVSWYCDKCHKQVHKELSKDWKKYTGFAVTRVISMCSEGDKHDCG
jgi:DNA-directed RNA polymerase subunit RPC12/RpoP